MSESPVERALDAVVYAPLGVALFARDTMPSFVKMFVARGRAAVDQQMTQARTVGQFAVKFGGPVVHRRMEDGVAAARARAENTVASLVVGRGGTETTRARQSNGDQPSTWTSAASTTGDLASARRPDATESPSVAPSPSALDLPISDYDELSASQVVQRLEGLTVSDLEAVRDYESAHRSRRTILGKIAQLRA